MLGSLVSASWDIKYDKIRVIAPQLLGLYCLLILAAGFEAWLTPSLIDLFLLQR